LAGRKIAIIKIADMVGKQDRVFLEMTMQPFFVDRKRKHPLSALGSNSLDLVEVAEDFVQLFPFERDPLFGRQPASVIVEEIDAERHQQMSLIFRLFYDQPFGGRSFQFKPFHIYMPSGYRL
jgi:hypothetical protein